MEKIISTVTIKTTKLELKKHYYIDEFREKFSFQLFKNGSFYDEIVPDFGDCLNIIICDENTFILYDQYFCRLYCHGKKKDINIVTLSDIFIFQERIVFIDEINVTFYKLDDLLSDNEVEPEEQLIFPSMNGINYIDNKKLILHTYDKNKIIIDIEKLEVSIL